MTFQEALKQQQTGIDWDAVSLEDAETIVNVEVQTILDAASVAIAAGENTSIVNAEARAAIVKSVAAFIQ